MDGYTKLLCKLKRTVKSYNVDNEKYLQVFNVYKWTSVYQKTR